MKKEIIAIVMLILIVFLFLMIRIEMLRLEMFQHISNLIDMDKELLETQIVILKHLTK